MSEEKKVVFESKTETRSTGGAGGAEPSLASTFPAGWNDMDRIDKNFMSDYRDLTNHWDDVSRHRHFQRDRHNFDRMMEDMWQRMQLDPSSSGFGRLGGSSLPPPRMHPSAMSGMGGMGPAGSIMNESAASSVIPPRPRDFGLERQTSVIQDDKEKWCVKLDVTQYTPEELEVKCRDNQVLVIGKHEERADGEQGYVSRQFTRRYVLPEDCDASKLTSSLGRDGQLTVEVSRLAIEGPTEKKIPIEVKPAN